MHIPALLKRALRFGADSSGLWDLCIAKGFRTSGLGVSIALLPRLPPIPPHSATEWQAHLSPHLSFSRQFAIIVFWNIKDPAHTTLFQDVSRLPRMRLLADSFDKAGIQRLNRGFGSGNGGALI